MYATSAISTVVHVEPVNGIEELEEREARDRVEQRRERRRSAARAGRNRCASSASGNAIAKPITTAISVSSMCWTSAGCERVAPVLAHPAPAEGVVAGDARAALAEVRDDGPGRRSSQQRSRRPRGGRRRARGRRRRRRPASPFVSSISETAFRTVVLARDAQRPVAGAAGIELDARRACAARGAAARGPRR